MHAVAAFRSERIILQKKMPIPIVARPAIVQRRITTPIFIAENPANNYYRAQSAAQAAVFYLGRPLLAWESQIFQKLFPFIFRLITSESIGA